MTAEVTDPARNRSWGRSAWCCSSPAFHHTDPASSATCARNRHGAGRVVRKTARRAGIGKGVTPLTLRHAFITAALDAEVPLQDMQEVASHADPADWIDAA